MSSQAELNPIATAANAEAAKKTEADAIRPVGYQGDPKLAALPSYSEEDRQYSREHNPGFDKMGWFGQQRALAYDAWARDADISKDDPETYFDGLLNNPVIEQINRREQAFYQSIRDAHAVDISTVDDAEAQALYMNLVRDDPRFGFDDDYDGTKVFGAEAGTGRENLKRLLDVYTGVNPNGLFSREAQAWLGLSEAQKFFDAKRKRSMGRAAIQAFDTPQEVVRHHEEELMQREDAVQFASLMGTISPRAQQYVLDGLKNGGLDERSAHLLDKDELDLALGAYKAAAPYTDAHWWFTQGCVQAWDVGKSTVQGSWRMLANVYNTTGGRNPVGSPGLKGYEEEQLRTLRLEDAMKHKLNSDELTALGSVGAGLLGTTPYMLAMSNPYTGTLATMGMMNDARERMVLSGVDPDKALMISIPVGVVEGYIEKIQWERYMGTGLTDLAMRQYSVKALAKALKKLEFREAGNILWQESKQTAVTYLTETTEEVLQQLTEDLGVQLGKNEYNVRELVESAYDTFVESSPTTLGFGLMRGSGVGPMMHRRFSRTASIASDLGEYRQGLNEANNILRDHVRRMLGITPTEPAAPAEAAPAAGEAPAATGSTPEAPSGSVSEAPASDRADRTPEVERKADEAMNELREKWYGTDGAANRYRMLVDYGLTPDQAAALDKFFRMEDSFGEDNPYFTFLTGVDYHGGTTQVTATVEDLPKLMKSVKGVTRLDDGSYAVKLQIADGTVVDLNVQTRDRADIAKMSMQRFVEELKSEYDRNRGEGAWDRLAAEYPDIAQAFINANGSNGLTQVKADGSKFKIDGHAIGYDGIICLARPNLSAQDTGARPFHLAHELFHAATLISMKRGILNGDDSAKLRQVFGAGRNEGELFDEEKAADAYAAWLIGRYEDKTGVFAKIRAFFKAIHDNLFGAPAPAGADDTMLNEENVFRAIERGDLRGISALQGIAVNETNEEPSESASAPSPAPGAPAEGAAEEPAKPATGEAHKKPTILVSRDIPGFGKVWCETVDMDPNELVLPGEEGYDAALGEFQALTSAETTNGLPLVAGGGNVVAGSQRVSVARAHGDTSMRVSRIRKVETIERHSVSDALKALDDMLAAMKARDAAGTSPAELAEANGTIERFSLGVPYMMRESTGNAEENSVQYMHKGDKYDGRSNSRGYGEGLASQGVQRAIAEIIDRRREAQAVRRAGSEIGWEPGREVIEIAKRNGCLISIGEFKDLIANDYRRPDFVGGEHLVWKTKDGSFVIKANGFFGASEREEEPIDVFDRYALHNQEFKDCAYELLGFTEMDRTPYLVVRQPFVANAREANQDEIDKYLKSHGFTPNGSGTWEKRGIILSDVVGNNVLVNDRGDVFVIDAQLNDTNAHASIIPGNTASLKNDVAIISDAEGDAAELDDAPDEAILARQIGTPFALPAESGAAVDGNDGVISRFTVKPGIEGIGCGVDFDEESGAVTVWHPGRTRKVTKDDPVTVDEIMRTKSPFTDLMTLAKSTIPPDDARRLAALYADIVNTAIGYIEDNGGNIHFLNAVWKWAGAEVFKSVKANGDAQYSLSVDMTTICKKTEQLMNVVSAFQVMNRRGATPAEMISLYLETGNGVEYDKDGKVIVDKNGVPVHGSKDAVRVEHFQTPCPCCYVFSHWIRTGLLLETAHMAQQRFAKDLEVVKSVRALRVERDRYVRGSKEWKDLDARYDAASRAAAVQMKALLKAEQDWQDDHAKNRHGKYGVNEAKKTMDAAGAYLDNIVKEIAIEQAKADGVRDDAKVARLRNRVVAISPIITDAYRLIAQSDYRGWLKSTVIRDLNAAKIYDDYEECPPEVLFAYNRAAELVVNYPSMARFRASKGSAGGKAIETDAHSEFGEIISGLAGLKKNGKPYNPFAVGDEKGMRRAYDAALLFAQRQRLRGGQRIFSWSDNLVKFGPDMFWNFLQLQSLGASVQSYSKQLEGVELICAMGGYNNGSLIAYGKGYEECAPDAKAGWDPVKGFYRSTPVQSAKDGKWYQLCYSKVQGINAEKLFELNNRYDRSGNIIVGMNENHIMLNISHHGIFFCIPWHASSLKAEFLEKMMELLREPLSGEKSQDHTKVQGDGILKEPKMPDPLPEGATEKQETEYRDAIAEYKERIKEWNKGASKRYEVTDFWSEIGKLYAEHDRFGKALPSCFKVDTVRGGLSDSQKRYAELRRRVLMGEATADELALAMKDVFLSQVIRKLQGAAERLERSMGSESKDVREVKVGRETLRLLVMQKSDAASIYPYEYWDEASHYYHLDPVTGQYVGDSTADCNGDRYLEYCRRMGAVPKFCGFQLNGTRFRATKSNAKAFHKNVGDVLMDYHAFEGYFKLLIDRRMYAIDGSYQDTDPVDATGMKMEHIRIEDLKRKWVDEKGRSLITTVADLSAAEPIARMVTYNNGELGLSYDSTDLGFDHDEAFRGADRATRAWKQIVKQDRDAAKAQIKVEAAAQAAARKEFEKRLGLKPGSAAEPATINRHSINLTDDPLDLVAAIVANRKRVGKPIGEQKVAELLNGIGADPRKAGDVMRNANGILTATRGKLKSLIDTKAITDPQFMRFATNAARQQRLLAMSERVGNFGYKLGVQDERRAQEIAAQRDQTAKDLMAAAEGFKADEMEAKYGFDIVNTVANSARAMKVKPSEQENAEDGPGEVNGPGKPIETDEEEKEQEPEEVSAPESALVAGFKAKAAKRADEIDEAYHLVGGTSPAQARANAEQKLENDIAAEQSKEGATGGEGGAGGDGGEGGEGEGPGFVVKRETLDFKRASDFLAFVEVVVENELKTRGSVKEGESAFDSPVNCRELVNTARHWLKKLATSLVSSTARELILQDIAAMDKATNLSAAECAIMNCYARIQERLITQTQRQLVRNLEREGRKLAESGKRFSRNGEERDRKVRTEVEYWWRNIKRYFRMDAEAIQAELDELDKVLEERERVADADKTYDLRNDREWQRATDLKNALTQYGGLINMRPAQIEEIANDILDQLRGSREELENAREDRRIEMQLISTRLQKAMVNPKAQRENRKPNPGWATRMFDSMMGVLEVRLRDLVRFAQGKVRTEAEADLQTIEDAIALASQSYNVYRIQQQDALAQFMKLHYGSPAAGVQRLTEVLDDEDRKLITKQGIGEMTRAWLLQRYVELLQTDDYATNIEVNKRNGKWREDFDRIFAKYISSDDLKLVTWFRDWYRSNLDDINNEVLVPISGIKQYSPSENYFPVKMKQKERKGYGAAAKAWSPYPSWLTPRVHNQLDFDESTDILTMWYKRMRESGVSIYYAKLGINLGDIFMNPDMKKVIADNHGDLALKRLTDHLVDIIGGGAKDIVESDDSLAFADRLRAWQTNLTLSCNYVSAFKQMMSCPVYALRHDIDFGMVMKFMTDIDIGSIRELMASDGWKSRYGDGYSEAIQNAMRVNARSGGKPGLGGIVSSLYNAGFKVMELGDSVPCLWVGQGLYRYNLAKLRDECGNNATMTEEEIRKRALTRTWAMIEMTQQSKRIENLTAAQRGGSLGRFLYQFLSSPVQQLAYEVQVIKEAYSQAQAYGGWNKVSPETKKHLYRTLVVNHILMPNLLNLGAIPDKDEMLMGFLISTIIGQYGCIFMAGAVGEGTLNALMTGKYNYRSEGLPVTGIADLFNKLGVTAHDLLTLDTDDLKRDVVRIIQSAGAPFRQAVKAYRNYFEDANEKAIESWR